MILLQCSHFALTQHVHAHHHHHARILLYTPAIVRRYTSRLYISHVWHTARAYICLTADVPNARRKMYGSLIVRTKAHGHRRTLRVPDKIVQHQVLQSVPRKKTAIINDVRLYVHQLIIQFTTEHDRK